jgi:DNA-binding response OmpR family regulator
MPRVDGLEATRRLLEHDRTPRVLMLTTFDADEYVYESLRAGASGFMLKDVRPEQLADAVRVVARGEALLAPAITRRLIEDFVRRPPSGRQTPAELTELTERELDVLRPRSARALECRDRVIALSQRGDRKDPSHAHPHEAQATRSRPGCRRRVRIGSRAAG